MTENVHGVVQLAAGMKFSLRTLGGGPRVFIHLGDDRCLISALASEVQLAAVRDLITDTIDAIRGCPHGNAPADCEACYRLGDEAADAAREDRVFGR